MERLMPRFRYRRADRPASDRRGTDEGLTFDITILARQTKERGAHLARAGDTRQILTASASSRASAYACLNDLTPFSN
jgi:hypothetical protein